MTPEGERVVPWCPRCGPTTSRPGDDERCARCGAITGGVVSPLDGLASTIAAHLPPVRPQVAPGLVVTVGEVPAVQVSWPRALPTLRQIRPDVVMLHTGPGAEDRPTADAVRALGARLWVQVGCNPYADGSESAAIDRARAWARGAVALGAELLSLNGEMASKVGRPGWDAPLGAEEAADEAQRLAKMIAAARAEAPRLALAWSSHDRPGRLPRIIWAASVGPDGVDYHLPQHYARPGAGPELATVRGALDRVESARTRWAEVPASVCRPELAPHGARWIPYAQAHHHEVAAACAIHDLAPLSAAWTLPEASDALGVLALRADAELRRRAGHAPGRIARWQTMRGLVADGVCGPRTLASLDLA